LATVAEIREALHNVIDPELGMNVIELGMIRDIQQDDGKAVVSMVLTTMSCPFWGLFVDQVETALEDVEGVLDVEVKYDGRERWSPDLMADEARHELEIMGLLPTTSYLN
jgi:metal-sulfur cluster biosynthetic enzyme